MGRPAATARRLPASAALATALLACATVSWAQTTPVVPEPLAGAVRMADIQVQKTFERTRLTKENFSAFASACLPTYPESAKDRFIAEWRLPLTNSTVILGHNKSAGHIQISSDVGICVRESENRYPILAIESLKATANPDGGNEQALDEFYKKIILALAERGYADVSYVFKQGNVQQVTYKVDRNEKGQLSYLETFRRKEFFQPVPGSLVYDIEETGKFTVTRVNGRVSKSIAELK
jgi:hypothetical protein